MDRSSVVQLVKQIYITDSIGNRVATEVARDVYCDIKSVTQTEWFEASRNGLNPQYQITMLRFDYQKEKIAVLNGVRYSVYRTYERRDDMIELYIEEKVGV